MKNQKPIKGRYYVAGLIAEGEHERQDFKFAVSDACKIARSLSAFANNAGGRLLVGVKDNGVIAGVRSDEDVYVLEQAAEMYCRPRVPLRVTPFACDGGLVVVRAEVAPSAVRPVKARDYDGRWRAYFRVKDENIAAPALMVRGWERAASRRGGLFALDGLDRLVLDVIASSQPLPLDDIYGRVRMPHGMVDDVLSALLSVSAVRLEYIDGRFCLLTVTEM